MCPAPPGRAKHRARSFHEEVLRTTKNLDSMIAQAGVTGAGARTVPEDLPPVPDTPEGAEQAEEAGEKHH